MIWRTVIFYGIILFAPIIRGGNRPLSLLILESLAILLLISLFSRPVLLSRVPRSQLSLILAVFILPLLYLIPMPFRLWEMMPGRGAYSLALQGLSPQIVNQTLPASMDHGLTMYSWLALLPPVAVFLYISQTSMEQYRRIVPIFIGLASAQAFLGLMQYSEGATSLLRLGWESGGLAIGTYANRNHLAGLLEMALPMSLAMMVATMGRAGVSQSANSNFRQSFNRIWGRALHQSFIYAFLSIVIFLGLIFTQSRAGIALSMVIIFIAMFSFSFRIGGTNAYGLIGSLVAMGISIALMIGLVPVLNRFSADPLKDSRWSIAVSTWDAIKAYFPIGSGVGTFSEVYQRFHAPDLRAIFINHAHNDYLEWLLEGGLAAGLLLICFFCLYGLQWKKVYKKGNWVTFNFIQVAAGIGLLALMLHSLVDYNLHIPANQIYFAMLAGLFFKAQETPSNASPR